MAPVRHEAAPGRTDRRGRCREFRPRSVDGMAGPFCPPTRWQMNRTSPKMRDTEILRGEVMSGIDEPRQQEREGTETMSQSNRRDILKRGVLAAAGLGILGGQTPALAIPPIGRTRPSHLKLSIAAYSYRDYLTSKPPRMTLFDYANLAADMGL